MKSHFDPLFICVTGCSFFICGTDVLLFICVVQGVPFVPDHVSCHGMSWPIRISMPCNSIPQGQDERDILYKRDR